MVGYAHTFATINYFELTCTEWYIGYLTRAKCIVDYLKAHHWSESMCVNWLVHHPAALSKETSPSPQSNIHITTKVPARDLTCSLSTVEIMTSASLTSLPPIPFNMTNKMNDSAPKVANDEAAPPNKSFTTLL